MKFFFLIVITIIEATIVKTIAKMTEPPLRKLKVSIMYSIADCHDKATVDAKAATMNSSKIFLNESVLVNAPSIYFTIEKKKTISINFFP